MGLGRRLAWHARVAWGLSKWVALLAFGLGAAMRLLLPVQDARLAGSVAAACAFLAVGVLALGSRGAPDPPPLADADAALERARGSDLAAHILARAALLLGALTMGLLLGGLAD